MNELKKLVLFCFVLCLTIGTASAETLIWSDEFDGAAVNTDNWSFDIGNGTNGWGNQELQWYKAENATVSGGNLAITVIEERVRGQNYTSARLKTIGKVQFQYGHVVARIKPANIADGLWPAFWMLGSNFEQIGWPDCGEVDIWEMGSESAIIDGVTNRRVNSAAHWEHNGGYAGYGLSYDAASDLNGSYHIMEIDWTPTTITTYIDGQQIWAIDITQPTPCTDCEEFHQPHFLLINVAVGGSFTGYFNPPTAPIPGVMEVDYIRLYDNGFTTNVTIPGGGAVCGDGTCDPEEDQCNCSDDCGTPPATETNCTDGIDEDCDGAADCADPTGDCDSDPACQTGSCNNDGVCDPGEDCDSCPNDCDSVTGGNPANRYCCGNGVVEGPEGDGRCDGNP
ncbi:MAG: glycoside hydrolase family 16 protein [Planctomycetes bacterium]|nr:glycoside hydrolase family 16 protein [Planctomycetota bacterium]